MARSQDDPLFGDVQHRTWTYRTEGVDSCTPGRLGDATQQPSFSNAAAINDNLYVNANAFSASDVYLNKHPYTMNMPSGDLTDEQSSINNTQSVPRANNAQNYGNAMLDLGNGQIMRVFFDENNKQIMIPVTGQYELFNHNQGLREMPLQSTVPSHMFTINQDFASKSNDVRLPQSVTASQNNNYPKENTQTNGATSSFLKDVLGNWEPNSSGTYSPFGHSFPLNHPEAPSLNLPTTQGNPHQPVELPVQNPVIKNDLSPKRNENSPLADTNNKKRIVAEVKPMRPSYSDVLAKNANNNKPEVSRKPKTLTNSESKNCSKTTSVKPERQNSANGKQNSDENKPKKENKKLTNTGSSGSESGDVNNYENEKCGKANKKSKNKQNNAPRKWSSMDDLTKDEAPDYTTNRNSQFVIIETQAQKPQKKEKKNREKSKPQQENNDEYEDEDKLEDEDSSQFDSQDGPTDFSKSKKKREPKSYTYKLSKPTPDKKKVNQTKWKRSKPGYLGVVQNYLDHWYGVSWKAMVWFLYLLSDICHMSAELSFDLCTSVFTQTYVSSQAVWRSTKDSIRKLANNKYLHYIDRKLGHTWFGFWRKIKWFRKEVEPEDGAATKLEANIPLPATGEEAMKRLLACKGKDPYSILGVHMNCSDEDIKRYYRRQAFLVHPDKNPQPGAEEAFKILQHAFELIGEPERRSAYGAAFAASAQAEAAWSELGVLLAQLHDKMERAANTIRCTNCGRRHKRVLTDRPCYAARYCAQCKIRHSAKEGDIWAESSMMGLLVMYYACMDGGVYQITQWASCQKKNLKQLRPDCHVVQYRIVLGNKAAGNDINRTQPGHDPNLEEFLNNLYSKTGPTNTATKQPSPEQDAKKRRPKKSK